MCNTVYRVLLCVIKCIRYCSVQYSVWGIAVCNKMYKVLHGHHTTLAVISVGIVTKLQHICNIRGLRSKTEGVGSLPVILAGRQNKLTSVS